MASDQFYTANRAKIVATFTIDSDFKNLFVDLVNLGGIAENVRLGNIEPSDKIRFKAYKHNPARIHGISYMVSGKTYRVKVEDLGDD